MAYLYSKEAEETFFLDPALNELFLFFYQEIRNTPYISRAKGLAERNEAKEIYC
jgi:hypothetical protein